MVEFVMRSPSWICTARSGPGLGLTKREGKGVGIARLMKKERRAFRNIGKYIPTLIFSSIIIAKQFPQPLSHGMQLFRTAPSNRRFA